MDNTFDPGTGADGQIRSTRILSGGKILIGGDFTTYNGVARIGIARLNPEGSLDTTFDIGTGTDYPVYCTAIQDDGKILIAGEFTNYNGTPRNRIARLDPDGDLDTTFDPGSGANSSIQSIDLQPDGKVIIGGDFWSYNGIDRHQVARLNEDGSLDLGFDPGTGANSEVRTALVQADGKVLIGGYFTDFNDTLGNFITRLNADGSLDNGFHVGTGTNGGVLCTSIQTDEKILIGGDFRSYNSIGCNYIARLYPDGTLDTGFNVGSGVVGWVYSTKLQSDGKILIGGDFTSYNAISRNHIARLNGDGSLDTSFDPGAGTDQLIYSVATQADGKILIGGLFNSYNGTARKCIARLNMDGSLDTGFDPGAGANFWINSVTVQPDGKILIGGEFTSYNGIARIGITRLNADGSMDTSFDQGTGTSSWVESISLQTDGKIVIGGAFSSYNGTSRKNIARLNADGSLDTDFDPGTGTNHNPIHATSIQYDGKILIGGNFTMYDGIARNCIARLHTDGSLDLGFDPGTGANNVVYSTTIQADGKILIGGAFWDYNGTLINRLARLNTDGSLDMDFTIGTGSNNGVLSSALQADGKILIGGTFTSYDGVGRNRIARLNNGPVGIQEVDTQNMSVFPNPSQRSVSVSTSMTGPLVITVTDLTGKLILKDFAQGSTAQPIMIRLDDQEPGPYFVSLAGKSGTVTERIIVQ
ncbi:MAG TPA: T9SS type A sorting domain-containing protein [Flavobacteriales bacterium]|nr:T9SS type A sorting domain-containing protein [Flavobacteriales bacterium]